MRNTIFVVGTTREANRIAWLLGKFAISVVRRTILKLCVDPARDQDMNLNMDEGQIGQVNYVRTDVIFMR